MKTSVFYIIMILIVSIGCNQQQASVEDEHDHGDVSFKYTAYTTDFEIFAEATPLIVGEISDILAHFSILPEFKSLNEGKVTTSLIVGTKGIRSTVNEPIRPGIYSFGLKPETAGKGKLIFDIETKDGSYSITIPNVEVFADEHDAIHEAEEAEIVDPNAITFTKEQSWKVDFATGLPTSGYFGTVIKSSAKAQPAQGDEVVITAKTRGIISFNEKDIAEGITVQKDKTLFSISGDNLIDGNMMIRYNKAKNNYENSIADFERLSKLAKDYIISEKELLDSKTEFENTRIIYENLKTNFNEKGQSISSPVNGFVKHMHITDGEFVEAGQPVVVVTQNKNLFLITEVQQKYSTLLPYIKSATIRPATGKNTYSLDDLNGKIVSYGKNISDENYLIPVTLKIATHEELFPGSIVEVNLIAESEQEVLTIPNSALIEEQGNFFVFNQLTPESFEKREIKVGETDGLQTVVLNGLNSSDRIVTKGAILVKLAAVSNSLDPHAGHIH
ncbi:MAG: efflux RND transporter periplasmic adaptor subunit [Mariniphaga sp.]|nr:efflux RND transporter periplasmic adaptor subunit [Mariniphaga sp.]